MTTIDKPVDEGEPAGVASPTSSPSLGEYNSRCIENVRGRLPDVARQLKEAGVARVEIAYDGCGDSGQIESIVCRDPHGQPLDPWGRVQMTEEAIMDLFYDLTQARHPGWENNDGACGEFAWDLGADTLHHSHSDRFMDYSTTEHHGL